MEPREQPRLLKRRVATAPTLLQPYPRTYRPREKREGDVDTLFKHANAKVVSLVALSDQTFSLESRNRDTIGPWQSHFERTIAVGSLRLYRAPGSVAFLSCGSVLQPILPKSQCWCMEEDGSEFILQIRPPSYWRIELTPPSRPGSENNLRDCLESVLLLDKTPCPFKESVPILLPLESLPPKNRCPWKPLRSYPSEPILARTLGGSSDSLLLGGDGLKTGTLVEVRDKGSSERPLGDDSNRANSRPSCSHVRDEIGSGRPEVAGQSEVIDEPSWRIHMQNNPSPACTLCHAIPGINLIPGIATQSHQDLLAISSASQTSIPLQPNEEGQANSKPRLIVNEGGKIQRRHTVASSGDDAELNLFIQKAKTSSVRSQEPSLQDKPPNTVVAAHSQQMSQPTMDVATAHVASPVVKSHRYTRATSPQNAARRRPHYREPSDVGNSGNGRRVSDPRKTATSPGTPGLRPRPAGPSPVSISLLLYTIFALVMLAAKMIKAAIVNLWKLVRSIERIHHHDQTDYDPDFERAGDNDI